MYGCAWMLLHVCLCTICTYVYAHTVHAFIYVHAFCMYGRICTYVHVCTYRFVFIGWDPLCLWCLAAPCNAVRDAVALPWSVSQWGVALPCAPSRSVSCCAMIFKGQGSFQHVRKPLLCLEAPQGNARMSSDARQQNHSGSRPYMLFILTQRHEDKFLSHI